MSSQLLTVLTGLCGLGLLWALALGFGALGRRQASGGAFWVGVAIALAGCGYGLSTGLRASAVAGTSEALHALPLVPVAKVAEVPPGAVVALVGVAKATASARVAGRQRPGAPAPAADAADAGNGLLAVEVRYTGEDEFEGEENDYISEVDYGRETDVAPFQLADAGGKPLLVDDDGFRVLAAGPREVRRIDTGEFSPVVNRNLMENESKASIPDGATVTVVGAVVDQGNQRVLMSMGPAISLLTDRPWASVLDEAKRKSDGEQSAFFLSFFLALLAAAGLGAAALKRPAA